jgi:hypothetical protein
MHCDPLARESFLVRLWSEPDQDQHILRGSIQCVRTGHLTFFDSIDLPIGLLRETAQRISFDDPQPIS